MDFLKHLAIPQSLEHFLLLRVMFNIVLALTLPYLGILLGVTLLSRVLHTRGARTGNAYDARLSRDMLERFIPNKSFLIYFAVLPVLSLAFIYAQIFQETPAATVSLMTWAVVFISVSTVQIYAYRYSTRLKDVLSAVPGQTEYAESNEQLRSRAGIWGVVTYGIGLLFFSASLTVAARPAEWTTATTIFDVLLIGDLYVRLASLFLFSIAITGTALPLFLLAWNPKAKGVEAGYAEYINTYSLKLTMPAVLVLPLTYLGSLFLLPGDALRGSAFSLVGASMILLLLAGQFLYALQKEGRGAYAIGAFFSMVAVALSVATQEQVVLGSATRSQAAHLAYMYNKKTDESRAALGIGKGALTGQEIFDAKCSACHAFDQVKVGPAYAKVLPKYEGKKEALVAFILNPQKIDPLFPPMPGQGLKPAEADSIASYLLTKFKQ